MNTIGVRRTRQRAAIEDLLERTDAFCTAREIHARLEEADQRIGLATVYRTLAAMAGAGAVDVITDADGESRYRACSAGHHHHLVCRACGRTIEVTATEVEAWASRTASEHGFGEVHHTVELTGVCADCAAVGQG